MHSAFERLEQADMEEFNASFAASISLMQDGNLQPGSEQPEHQSTRGVSTRHTRRDEQEYHPPQVASVMPKICMGSGDTLEGTALLTLLFVIRLDDYRSCLATSAPQLDISLSRIVQEGSSNSSSNMGIIDDDINEVYGTETMTRAERAHLRSQRRYFIS